MSLDANSIKPAVNVLAHHGKSFRFAGRFLNKEQLQDCARLYRFCRFVDDLVDETPDRDIARNNIAALKRDLELGHSSDTIIEDFINLASAYQMQSAVIMELIKGIESDLNPVIVADKSQLLRYCYRVAGTVGLLMCDVLGVSNKQARAHAIDLGIGMQLTNIARDVLEDALRGRRYVPTEWVGKVSPQTLAKSGSKQSAAISKAVQSLLGLADKYYESGQQGLRFLPPRARLGITIAARVYQEIGRVLEEKGFDIFAGRAYVSLPRKTLVALRAISSRPASQPYIPHAPELHIRIADLPHAHASA